MEKQQGAERGTGQAARFVMPRLPGTLSEQHDADRLEQYHEVQEQRVVLHVIEVVFELAYGLLHGCAVRVPHLRPAG